MYERILLISSFVRFIKIKSITIDVTIINLFFIVLILKRTSNPNKQPIAIISSNIY